MEQSPQKARNEKILNITLRDGLHVLTGTLRKTTGLDRICIFIPGFIEGGNEHIFFNGCRYLSKCFIDSFRFSFHGIETRQRSFRDVTLQTMVQDLEDVIKHFKHHYERISLVAHSLACPIALSSNLSPVNSLVFWEPSIEPYNMFDQAEYWPSHGVFIMHTEPSILIGADMIQSAKKFPSIPTLMSNLKIPLKIITGTKTGAGIAMDIYCKYVTENKTIINIESAGHNFDGECAEPFLFEETLEWIRSH